MSDGRLRYVVLRHEVPPDQTRTSHWDLLIEWDADSLLLTWELPSLPTSGQNLPAQPLAPHRRRYLDYEGPLSEGRGSVTRWDAGHYLMVGGEPIELARCQLGASSVPMRPRESTGTPEAIFEKDLEKNLGKDLNEDLENMLEGIPKRGRPFFRLRLDGKRLQGELTLQPPTGDDQFWNVSFVGNIAVR